MFYDNISLTNKEKLLKSIPKFEEERIFYFRHEKGNKKSCPANRNKGLSDYQKETVLRSKMFYYKEDFFVLKDREGNVMGITSISNNHPETDILEITTLLVPEEILEQVLIGCEQLLKSLYPFNISKLRIKTIGSDLEMLEKQLFNCGFKKVSQLMDEYGKGNDLIIYDWTV